MEDFKIDPKSGMPIWVQLRNRLLFLITSGYYEVGDQLPTLHNMATQLSINYNTVNKVYQSLERDGLIESRRGFGTVVVCTKVEGQKSPATTAELLTVEYLDKMADLGLTTLDVVALIERVGVSSK